MTKKFSSDIDIDFGDREEALKVIKHIPAGIIRNNELVKHNSGVFVTEIPVDPFTGYASIDYKDAEDRGYLKLDFLNVGLYKQVKDEQHLVELMREPDWDKLYDRQFCEQLIHVNNHYDTLIKMPEAVNSIARLSMFLAIIRPAKRYLIGRTWKEVAEEIWTKVDGEYAFKRSHSCAYAHLVVVNMNLLTEQGK